MKRMFRNIVVLVAMMLMFVFDMQGQVDAQLSQYWAIPTYYNAGASGSSDYLRINGGARLQWLGIENAPQSFLGQVDMPLNLFGKRIGVGAGLQSETMGLFSNLNINAQFSYKIKLLKGELSIGAQVGYFEQKFKGSEVEVPDDDDYHDSSDQAIPTQDLKGGTVDVSAGIFYTHKYFWVGVSGLHLLQPTVKMGLEGSESTASQEYETVVPRTLYFMGGSNIPLKNTLFELQPSLMVKTDFSVFSAEITARARYNKFLSFGVGYRWKEAVMIMAGAEYKNFFVGYAYDYPLSAIARASSGSHELLVGYKMKIDLSGKNKNKHRSIRIM
ncbi:MAG: type IX secretion system membrane protein PorP/SprF [Muribaculaceae bacterium]|nr:type IX secretion system membrane protein PorP/SprF [Muribaculaceae bacterium]